LRPLIHGAPVWPYVDWVPALRGMQAPQEAPKLTLKEIWDGRFQRAAESWVTSNLLQRPVVVRGFNEIVWRLFGTSYMANRTLIANRDGTLFEENYIMAYCGQLPSLDPTLARIYAARVRKVQDWFASRGQFFAYLVAPTKPFFFRDALPSAFPCEGPLRDQIYSQTVAKFRDAGVNFVDGRAALVEAQLPVSFPRNGIHYNRLGAAVVTEAVVRELRRQGLSGLADFKYEILPVLDEIGLDRDLSDLLNLWRQPRGAPSFDVRAITAGPNERSNRTMVVVHDSFFEFPAELLGSSEIFQTVDTYSYLSIDQKRMTAGAVHKLTLEPDAILANILAADAVVLEVVETAGDRGVFITRTLDMIEKASRGQMR
jgi:hypothetical protein